MPGADAFLGKITPAMLARADRLRWVQTFTASLEHYMFPELVAHPCVLTNMRGLFGDVIADQVMGYVLCFARNLHTYIRQQVEHRYEPVGGESARVSIAVRAGDGQRDGPRDDLPARRDDGDRRPRRDRLRDRAAALAFGMTVRGVDRFPDRVQPPEGVEVGRGHRRPGRTARLERLRRDRRARTRPRRPASSTPRCWPTCSRPSYLINIGRGAIVVLDDLVAALRAGRARRRGARRLRGRAAAGRSPALGLPQRDPHARTPPAIRP